jgi:hypothetical protein
VVYQQGFAEFPLFNRFYFHWQFNMPLVFFQCQSIKISVNKISVNKINVNKNFDDNIKHQTPNPKHQTTCLPLLPPPRRLKRPF